MKPCVFIYIVLCDEGGKMPIYPLCAFRKESDANLECAYRNLHDPSCRYFVKAVRLVDSLSDLIL